LLSKKCKPCEGGVLPLTPEEAVKYMSGIDSSWQLIDNIKIKREFSFSDFAQTMKFVGKIAVIAEEEGHHPDMCIHYNTLEVELTTHAIKGLSENDFILAAKIDSLI
jgi:4a-hydroxytetrahydrobiopterin dehydratase